MRAPARTQYDDLHDAFSLATAIDCSDLPDMARQEFKDEADTNWILDRFGVNAQQRPLMFGAMDFDLDLQQAKEAVRQVQEAEGQIPEHLRAKYPSWEAVFTAIDSGELTSLEKPAPAVGEPEKASTSGDA